MAIDEETEAIAKVAEALSGLNPEAVERVIQWAAARHKVAVSKSANTALGGQVKEGENPSATGTASFESFVDLYDAADPDNENDKVLVGAYWQQQIQKTPDWGSQEVNDLLKDLGHTISNITRTLGNLQDAKPRLAIQISKAGKSKQARKRYKLTNEGLKRVKKLIAKETDE